MGLYYSEDRRYCTSTLDYPPVTFLTDKGLKDTAAAIIIQRWWKHVKPRVFTDNESYMADNSDNSFECIRRSYKRKLDEMTDTDIDSDLDVEEINSSEFSDSSDSCEPCESSESSESSESLSEEYELQTVVDNNFLWEFWLSLYSFLWRVLGY